MRNRKPKLVRLPDQRRRTSPVSIDQLLTPGVTAEQAAEHYHMQTGQTIPAGVMDLLLRHARRGAHAGYLLDVVSDFERSSLCQGQPTTQLYKLIVGRQV